MGTVFQDHFHVASVLSKTLYALNYLTFLTHCHSVASAPSYLIRDRDRKYDNRFRSRLRSRGIEEVLIAPRSPRQSPYVERLIGSIRRECLRHVIVLNERHPKKFSDRTSRIIMRPEHILV